ncbi:MAG: zinc ribbon domain-containing protein [Minisyncoccia bacterium]
MNLFFWRKNPEEQNSAYAPYEEIDAKRTSKLGYFFLILMVIFGVAQGQNFLGALKNSIALPEANSYCLTTLAQYVQMDTPYNGYVSYSDYGYYGDTERCIFSAREKQLAIDVLYAKIAPSRTEIASLESSINELNIEINEVERKRRTVTSDYDISLQEKMAATENAVFDPNGLQNAINAIDANLNQLRSSLASATARKQTLESTIAAQVTPYKSTLQEAFDQYAHDMAVYQFKQFLLSLLLIAPLFMLVWRLYNRAKERRSEYAIIWGGAVATVGIMLAEILLMFVYQILPHKILQQIFAFLAAFDFIWALLYWLGFILVPLFFGFLIYLIQKKFYNKRAVMMRALKNEHCPHCSLKTHHSMNNCPVCGYKLKSKCTSCGAMSMDGGSFCEGCGKKMSAVSE